MAENATPPEGGTGAADTELATLKAELEAAKAEALREKTEREKLESIRTELETTRQAAKERERKALEEQGQFKTIAEQTQAELDRIKAEQEAIKARAEAAESQLKARDDAERAAILESIPEANRKEWEDSDLPTLRKVAPLYGQTNGKTPSKAPASGKYTAGPVDFSEMSVQQQSRYAADHNMTKEEIAAAYTNALTKKRQNTR